MNCVAVRAYLAVIGVCCLGSLIGPSAAYSQAAPSATDRADDTRPKIGLALSGGGARGGAHIGVLLALRELRIPVDYVAGTSMGAVIGGLFASGLTETELDEVVRTIAWEDVFADRPARDDRSFHRKQDDELHLVNLRPGFNNGQLQLPAGLVQGQGVDLLLSRLTLAAAGISDFDELPIPFRAVAADIVTGEAVILGQGSLGRAIRASLSIPAVIAPTELDGRLLVDGGIAMNLPVEVVRNMGADLVIAIDIGTPLRTREEVSSVLAIAGQLTGFLTRRGTDAQVAKLLPEDVLIVPLLGDLSNTDFARITDTIAAGYEATMAAASELAALELSENDYQAHQSLRRTRDETLPTIDFVRANNESHLAESLVNARLDAIPTGVPFDVTATEAAVAKIHGLGLFQNVRYSLVDDGDLTGLEIDAQQESWGPNYLQFGLQYSGSNDDETQIGLSLSYLRTALNAGGGELRTNLLLGDERTISTELHQPMGPSAMFFVAPEFRRETSLVNVFDAGARIAKLQTRQLALSVSAGRELDTWGELRVGLTRGSGDAEVQVGDPAAFLPVDFDVGELFTRFTSDTLDRVYFPSGGGRVQVEWRTSRDSLGAAEEYEQAALRVIGAKTFGRHTVVGGVRYDTTIDGTAPVHALSRLGGFFNLSGFSQNELSGQHSGRLLAAYYRRVGNFARLPIYAGATLEVGNVWQTRDEISLDNSIGSGSIWVGADTVVGPVYLGYGRAEGGVNSVYFYLGRVL
jgi:NTE family protein